MKMQFALPGLILLCLSAAAGASPILSSSLVESHPVPRASLPATLGYIAGEMRSSRFLWKTVTPGGGTTAEEAWQVPVSFDNCTITWRSEQKGYRQVFTVPLRAIDQIEVKAPSSSLYEGAWMIEDYWLVMLNAVDHWSVIRNEGMYSAYLDDSVGVMMPSGAAARGVAAAFRQAVNLCRGATAAEPRAGEGLTP